MNKRTIWLFTYKKQERNQQISVINSASYKMMNWRRCLALIAVLDLFIQANAFATNTTLTAPKQKYKGSKFSIDDLLNTEFSSKISDDIDMDPCKASEFMGDIALPNINYDHDWQQQRLNKTFQQELEQLKKEVYHEGLQVEEEGLTDIIRKKTKLPPDSNPISSHNEPSTNDAILVVPDYAPNSLYLKGSSETSASNSSTSKNDTTSLPSGSDSSVRSVSCNSQYQASRDCQEAILKEKSEKSVVDVFRDIDSKKIQSNAKDIEDESANILQSNRNSLTSATTAVHPSTNEVSSTPSIDQTPEDIADNSSTTPAISTTETVTLPNATDDKNPQSSNEKRRRRRHFQQKRRRRVESELTSDEKEAENSYQARLKRLREELNAPTMTEVIQMHKMAERNQNAGREGVGEGPSVPMAHINNTAASNTLRLNSETFESDSLSLSQEELFLYVDDPWWKTLRRSILISFWILLLVILTLSCIISFIEFNQRCNVKPPIKNIGIGHAFSTNL